MVVEIYEIGSVASVGTAQHRSLDCHDSTNFQFKQHTLNFIERLASLSCACSISGTLRVEYLCAHAGWIAVRVAYKVLEANRAKSVVVKCFADIVSP